MLSAAEQVDLQEDQTTVSLVDILLILSRRKVIWIASTLVFGLIGVLAASLMPVRYEAEADILPPQQAGNSSSLLMGQVGNLLGLGGGGGFGGRDPNDTLLAILRSRTVADAIIQEAHLEDVYNLHDIFLAEHKLKTRSMIGSTMEGAIAIRVDDHDPVLAAKIANLYVSQLTKQNGKLAFGEASRRRIFFERQLASEKEAFADAEVGLKQTQLSSGVIELQSQTQIALRSTANLSADITNSQIELQSLQSSETENNPDLIRLRQHIEAQRAQLAKLQGGSDSGSGTNLSTSSVPGLGLDYVRKLREVKYHETLFDLLTRQYEAAKIDESKEAPAVQVIDAAEPPHFPSWPPKTLIAVAAALVGLFIGVLIALVLDFHQRALRDPSQAYKWSALRNTLSLR